MRYSVFRVVFLFLFCAESIAAQENPFIEMANKPYNQYFEYVEKNIYFDIEQRDSTWVKHIADQMREAAKVSKNKKWTLEADFCENMYRFFRDQIDLRKPNQIQMDSLAIIFIDKMQPIIQQARKIGAFDVELRVMFRVLVTYIYDFKNYEMGFRYGLEFDKALMKVSAEEFPLRPRYYSEIGKLYYSFREYETARIYFEKGLEGFSKHKLLMTNQDVFKTLWNNMGLIYRNHYNDLAKSDSCFLQILEIEFQNPDQQFAYDSAHTREEYELWQGIAKGNLGTNHHRRGEYQQAIPLLKYGIEKTVKYNDFNFPYAIGKSILLSEIFLDMSDLTQAKRYLDNAADFLDRLQQRSSVLDVKTDIELWIDYYKMRSRYYRTAGDNAQALLYADSTAEMKKQLEDEFNLRKLLRVEQQVNQEKLDAEVFRSKTYFRILLGISVCALLLITLFTLLYRSYRKKQDAYRELVRKSQQWAAVIIQTDNTVQPTVQTDANELTEHEHEHEQEQEHAQETQNALPYETYFSILKNIERLMTEEKIYKNDSLSVASVASMLGVRKDFISGAINRCTKKDFSTFVNEYRIKEAIRLLSEMNFHRFSLDSVAFESGFSDRRHFNRVFKKMTGLTPTEFLREK